MGFLTKFFKSNKKEDINHYPVLTMLFDKLPEINTSKIEKGISRIEKLNKKIKITQDNDLSNKDYLISIIEFDNHKIKLVGFDAPMPQEVIDNTVNISFWEPEQKEMANNHKSHIICYYDGKDNNPIEQYISLFKVASAFQDEGLIGLVNEQAWNYNPEIILNDLLSEDMLKDIRKNVPLLFWTGFIKMPAENGIWFTTKGNNTFGVNEFAYFGKSLNESEEVRNIFDNLFNYIYKNKVIIEPGHTMQMGKNLFKFNKVTEYPEYLESKLGTLVIEK